MATRDIAAEMLKATSKDQLDKLYAEREAKIANQGITGVEATTSIYERALSGLSQPSATVQPTYNPQSYIDDITKAQREATIASLGKSRDAALSNISREREQIAPTYRQARSTTRAQSQTNARKFADYMAQRGLNRSGGAALGETQRLGALQGAIGSLNQEEANAFTEADRRQTDIQNAYLADMDAANANLEAQRLQSLLGQYNTDRGFGLQEAGVTGLYNGEQTFAARQADFSNNIARRTLELQEMGFTADEAYRQATLEMERQELEASLNSRALDDQYKRLQISNYGRPSSSSSGGGTVSPVDDPGLQNLQMYIRDIGLSPDGVLNYLNIDKNYQDWVGRFGENAVRTLIEDAMGSADGYASLINGGQASRADLQPFIDDIVKSARYYDGKKLTPAGEVYLNTRPLTDAEKNAIRAQLQ